MFSFAGLIGACVLGCTLQGSLGQVPCTLEEEGHVLNELATWHSYQSEDYEFLEGANLLLAGGYRDHCKVLSILSPAKFKGMAHTLAKKLDEESWGGLPEGNSQFVRGMLEYTMSPSNAQSAGHSASAFGRVLQNPNINAAALDIVKKQGVVVVKKALQSPTMTGILCGAAVCPTPSALAAKLGIKGFKAAGVALTAVPCAWNVAQQVRQWYKGEISGQTASVEIAAGLAEFAGGLAGAHFGGTIGASLGAAPGAVLGGMFGGVAGSMLSGTAMKTFLMRFFNIAPDAMVQKCYEFFKIRPSASNSQVNKAYHAAARKAHPDKRGGSQEKQTEVNLCLEVIRAERKIYEESKQDGHDEL